MGDWGCERVLQNFPTSWFNEDSAILELPLGKLIDALSRGELSAVQVLRAYRSRAEKIHHACNCVTVWIDDAEKYAEQADDHLHRTGKPLGPLHGVPFSVKDHINTAGTPITNNMLTVKKRGGKSKRDEHLVTTLRGLGAIPFAKTNMSQMGATGGGGGPAWGDTLNPWNTLRTTGGSSAGEGAIIGGGASPFGIGSDIGGSLRGPSAYCGICTLKPTTGRVAILSKTGGDHSVVATSGIMAKTAEDVALVHAALLRKEFFDGIPRLARIPFDHAEFSSTRKLRIGFYTEEYTFPAPCPTVERAVKEVVDALQRRGHEVVPFHPHSSGTVPREEVFGCDQSFGLSEGPYRPKADRHKEREDHEKLSESERKKGPTESALRALCLPDWADADEPIHPDLAAPYMGVGEPMPVKGLTHGGKQNGSSAGLYGIFARRDMLRERFYAAWRKAGLDAVICPTKPLPAPHVEDYRYLHQTYMGVRIFNFMDQPAGVVTVTTVTAADLQQPYDPKTTDPEVTRAAKRCLEGAEGHPISVQVATLPWQEELCLRVMCEVGADFPFGGHTGLAPVPRRCPTMGARPEPLPTETAQAKL